MTPDPWTLARATNDAIPASDWLALEAADVVRFSDPNTVGPVLLALRELRYGGDVAEVRSSLQRRLKRVHRTLPASRPVAQPTPELTPAAAPKRRWLWFN